MDEIKLLMIGNSFSWNAYTYLQSIADSANVKMTVGDLCYGGCTLEQHEDFIKTKARVYGYEHTRRKTNGSCDLDTAIASDSWTHVSLQQVSYLAGIYESYQPYLDFVYNYVRRALPDAEIIIHETWAYEKGSTHDKFYLYNHDQQLMSEKIREAYILAANAIGAKRIVPSGEAFALARASAIGDSLCEDGFHANSKGQYLAGGAFFETVTGVSIFDTAFAPPDVSADELAILRECIHKAVAEHSRV